MENVIFAFAYQAWHIVILPAVLPAFRHFHGPDTRLSGPSGYVAAPRVKLNPICLILYPQCPRQRPDNSEHLQGQEFAGVTDVGPGVRTARGPQDVAVLVRVRHRR